jgi:hypothetical protein
MPVFHPTPMVGTTYFTIDVVWALGQDGGPRQMQVSQSHRLIVFLFTFVAALREGLAVFTSRDCGNILRVRPHIGALLSIAQLSSLETHYLPSSRSLVPENGGGLSISGQYSWGFLPPSSPFARRPQRQPAHRSHGAPKRRRLSIVIVFADRCCRRR